MKDIKIFLKKKKKKSNNMVMNVAKISFHYTRVLNMPFLKYKKSSVMSGF